MMRSRWRRCKNPYICQPAALSRQSSVPLSDRLSAALARMGVPYGWVAAMAVRLLLFGLMGPFAAATGTAGT